MNPNSIGVFGEEKASEYLEKAGYKIIKRNFSCRFGEIDIIACDNDYIVFAEVKLRKSDNYGAAAEFVSKTKQSKIIKTAQYYLRFHASDLQPRFDVIEIYAPEGRTGSISLNHIENAFW